jgi:GNAT superfamily N-acetyltransferase
MTIREAAPADVPALLAIVDEAYSPYIARNGKKPGPMFDDYDALVESRVVWVIEDEAGVAGLVVLLPLEGKALLDNVAVASRARGKGLGRLLIEHGEALAKQGGFSEIILYTQVIMTENRTIYPHLGYRETHRATEKGLDRVYFSKRLSSS